MEKREERARRLTTLRDRFIAVSMRSRTLRIARPTASGAIDLTRLHRIEPARWEALSTMLGKSAHAPVPLCPKSAADELGALASDIYSIDAAARTERTELGQDTLALGWPLLQGKTADGTWLRAPLMIYPITLTATKKGKLSWEVEPDGPPVLNEALVQALIRLCGVKLEFEEFMARDEDGVIAMDSESWRGLLETLIDAGVPITGADEDGDEDTAPGPPRALGAWTSEQRAAWPSDSFELRHTLVLGRFPIASSNVVLDYQDMLATTLDDATLGAAAIVLGVDEDRGWTPGEDTQDIASVDREEVSHRVDYRPFLSDTSQDAVARMLAREDAVGLVVQGPPGTGKSQMIANLLCDAVARGSRVLMVCQKRAALDVVAQRLAALGVREAIAVVHDGRRDRQDVCTRLGNTLDALLDANPNAANATRSQIRNAAREHERAALALRTHLTRAQDAWALFAGEDDVRPGLAELQESRLDDPGDNLPDLVPWYEEISLDALATARARVEQIAMETSPIASPHPWEVRTTLAGSTALERSELAETVRRIFDLLEANVRHADRATMTPTESAALASLWERLEPLTTLLRSRDEQALGDFSLFWIWSDGSDLDGEWRAVMDRLQRARRELKPIPWVLFLRTRAELEGWIAQLVEYKAISVKWWRFFSPTFWRLRKTSAMLLDLIAASGFGQDTPGLPVDLEGLCRGAIAWQEFVADLPTDSAFFDFGFEGRPDEIEDAIESGRTHHRLTRLVHMAHEELGERAVVFEELPDILSVDPVDMDLLPFFASLLANASLAPILDAYDAQAQKLERWLTQSWRATVRETIARGDFDGAMAILSPLLKTSEELEEIARVDAILADEPAWARSFLRGWRQTEGRSAAEDLRRAVERAWYIGALHGVREPVARAPLVREDQREALLEMVDRTRELAAASILTRYQERLLQMAKSPDDRRALQQLAVQAKKQRYRLSLRQLIEQFWESGLAAARPIWLCSPESVASMFPLKGGMFDLVIFDEASQCPVESSIGALVRAKRVVIAGDDQQMPPSHFFQASTEEMDEEDAQEETLLASRSVLEVSRLALDSTTLRWHYRSEDEQLISFSNAAFYGGKLYTAPRATREQRGERERTSGVIFEQVEGIWEKQTNAAEAARVVEWVKDLLTAPNPPSVGIVTFNLKQAELIERALVDLASEDAVFARAREEDAKRPLVDQLFVRNLENVQGDERDVMIMSVGYGPSEVGGKIHARFGPLGMDGGDKRLNVAITRARQAYLVITSFDPDALSVANTRHIGPKLFKVFLRYTRALTEGRTAEVEACLARASELAGSAGVAAMRRVNMGRLVGAQTRDEMARELRERGYEVEVDVGMGNLHLDMSVHHPERPESRLGLDLINYLSIPDAMTREVYLPRFWARMGWRIMRLTPGMWSGEREEVLAAIAAATGHNVEDATVQ